MAGLHCYNAVNTENPLTGRPHREWCVRVAKGFRKKRREKDQVAEVAGWGEYGFRTRSEGSSTLSVWVEGQEYHKSSRKSVARARKPGCRLASRTQSRGRDGFTEALETARRKQGKSRFRARKGQRPA